MKINVSVNSYQLNSHLALRRNSVRYLLYLEEKTLFFISYFLFIKMILNFIKTIVFKVSYETINVINYSEMLMQEINISLWIIRMPFTKQLTFSIVIYLPPTLSCRNVEFMECSLVKYLPNTFICSIIHFSLINL